MWNFFNTDNHYDYCDKYSLEELSKNIVDSNEYYGSDIACAICRIIDTTNLYRKDDIKEEFWKHIKANLIVVGSQTVDQKINWHRNNYDAIFNLVWMRKCSMKNKPHKLLKICNIAGHNRPVFNKLYNSNIALIVFFFVFLLCVQLFVIELFPELLSVLHRDVLSILFVFNIASLTTVCTIVKSLRISIGFAPVPICVFLIFLAVYHLFNPPSTNDFMMNFHMSNKNVLALAKLEVMLGLSYFLWIPILLLNEKRLEDVGYL